MGPGDPGARALAQAQAFIDAYGVSHAVPRVVEAGCGARSHVRYPPGSRVVGVDILFSQLRRNTSTSRLAQADVAMLPIATASADIVVCWDVLEHVPEPDRVLGEIARVLAVDGLAVLALPNILSLKGLVTRLTPWWFHVWVYRRVLGDASAGTDASDQFPTAFRFALRPSALRRLAATHGLTTRTLLLYEGPVPLHLRRRYRVADLLLSAVGLASRLVSAGRYDATHSDMIVVLTRDAEVRS